MRCIPRQHKAREHSGKERQVDAFLLRYDAAAPLLIPNPALASVKLRNRILSGE